MTCRIVACRWRRAQDRSPFGRGRGRLPARRRRFHAVGTAGLHRLRAAVLALGRPMRRRPGSLLFPAVRRRRIIAIVAWKRSPVVACLGHMNDAGSDADERTVGRPTWRSICGQFWTVVLARARAQMRRRLHGKERRKKSNRECLAHRAIPLVQRLAMSRIRASSDARPGPSESSTSRIEAQ